MLLVLYCVLLEMMAVFVYGKVFFFIIMPLYSFLYLYK